MARTLLEIPSDVQAHDHRQQNDHEQHREDADHHRHGQLGRQRISSFLGPREPLVAHVIAVDAHCVGNARPEIDRLVDQSGKCACFFKREAIGEILERLLERNLPGFRDWSNEYWH